MPDVMDQPWCCLTCNAKFTFGECRSRPPEGRPVAPPYAPGAPAIYCPKCGSADRHPADGTVRDVPEYVGEIGRIN